MALWRVDVFECCDNGQLAGSPLHEQWEGELIATVYDHTQAAAERGADLVAEQRDGLPGVAQPFDSARCAACPQTFSAKALTLYVADCFGGPPEVATELWCPECHAECCERSPVFGADCPGCFPGREAAARLRAEAGLRRSTGEREHAEIFGEVV